MKHAIETEWFHTQLKRQGKSVRDLARAMALEPSAVSRMLRGERGMRADEQDKIAAYLGLSVAEIASHRTSMAARPHRGAGGFGEMPQNAYATEQQSPPTAKRIHPLFGSMKGTTIVMPGVDLTEPADPDLMRIYDEDYDPLQLEVDRIKSDISLSEVGKIWALSELGLDPLEISAAVAVTRTQIDDALAARRKVRGW